ncbi:MAG TPA: ATP-binding protein [Verrucomicrobiae bacterium]|nr:ATP-binding protein [Verrucomicrobiae bacterium]
MPSHIELDATPTKEIYRSIIADYSLNAGICELVDNALDVWSRGSKISPVEIDVDADHDQQTISISDNAGGVGRNDLEYLVKPGSSSTDQTSQSIGVFGVGCKRGPIALAQRVDIYTQRHDDACFRIPFDDDWISNSSWRINVEVSSRSIPGQTIIQLSRLRARLNGNAVDQLIAHLGLVYGKFLSLNKCTIHVNKRTVVPLLKENWSFPPEYLPHCQDSLFQTPEGEIVTARITVGFRSNRDDEEDYGVYFYCNDRLIQSAAKDHAVGYFAGAAGKPHFDASLVRAIVEFSGSARQMPWNTSKTAIQYHHKTFKHIEKWLHNSLKKFTQVSRALRDSWDESVFPHQTGKVAEAAPSFDEVPLKTFTLARPETRKSYEQRMVETNQEVADKKPWTTGLYEGVVATHILIKTHLKERNRIALIILDSTLEIAFKDYLSNETANSISDDRLSQLAKERKQLVDEIVKQKPSLIDQAQRQQLDYFYRLRCKLVHERSNAGINPDDLEKYRHLVQKLLNKMFGIRFVESTGK